VRGTSETTRCKSQGNKKSWTRTQPPKAKNDNVFECRADGGVEGWQSQIPPWPRKQVGGERGQETGPGRFGGPAGGRHNLDGTGRRQGRVESRRRAAWCHSHGMRRCRHVVDSILREREVRIWILGRSVGVVGVAWGAKDVEMDPLRSRQDHV